MKKLSVQTKYALVLAAILVVLVGLQLLFNHVFMEKYYLNRKLDRIGEIRAQAEEYIRENSAGAGAEDSEMKLRTGCEAAGIDALIIKEAGRGHFYQRFRTGRRSQTAAQRSARPEQRR